MTSKDKRWWAGEDGSSLMGFIDENGKMVISTNYSSASYFSCGWAKVEEDKEKQFIDKDGKVAIPEQFFAAYSFAGDIALVVDENDRYGVIDKKGNFLIDFQKKYLLNMGEGRVAFYNYSTSKYGIMDKNGNEIVSAKYDNINPFTCGLANVVKNDKWGYINTKGEEVIPCRYFDTFSFYGDVADVQKSEDSRWEIIDKKGESLITLKENEVLDYYFINGLGLVKNEETNQYRYITKKNETIYKWEPGSSSMPEKRLSPEERRMQFMLSTEYGPLFRDMMERTK